MNLIKVSGPNEFAQAAAQWCRDSVAKYNAKSIFVPAGQTPVALYELWEREMPSYLKGIELLQIDEVLAKEASGLFRSFLETHLAKHQAQLRFIDDASNTADLAILGLGLNGHVAFHEPGLPDSFRSGCVRLSEITCENLKIPNESWGVTYGVDAFMQSKAILMMVSGESKREILSRLLNKDPSLPATALLKHTNFTLLYK